MRSQINRWVSAFFNNVAVAAKVILQKTAIRKILILDWWVDGINTSGKDLQSDQGLP
jgi:hypothetical protein